MNISLATRVNKIKPSPTLSLAAKAAKLRAEGVDIINLSAGEPDFDTPEYVKEAAKRAMDNGDTKYTAVDGTKALKQAIIQKFMHDNNLSYVEDEIIVSTGAKQSLYNLFMSVLEAGDEVIIPAPFWVSYPDMVLLADATPVIVHTDETSGFKLTAAQLETNITPNTKLLVINSPSNPTGGVYSKEELQALSQVLLKHPHILIVTDDIYEHILWNTTFYNILMVCPLLKDRTIVVNGLSKAYAMTGWRIGYAAAPLYIAKAMLKIQGQSTSNACSIAQAAATAALLGDNKFVTNMCQEFKKRHDFLVKELNSIPGFKCAPNNGTFYLFVNVIEITRNHPTLNTAAKLAEHLLNNAKVAVVPGEAFGSANYLRLSFAASMTELIQAIERIRSSV